MIQSSSALKVEVIREDFPILRRQVDGKPLTYLDSAATSQKPEAVLAAMEQYYRSYNANVHRGIYRISEESTARYEEARAKVAAFIHARSPKGVIFTRNATEAINLVAWSWGRANFVAGDAILLSEMEHHSNLVPWQLLAKEKGLRLEFLRIDGKGLLDLGEAERLLSRGVKLVSITHVSNVLGTINPVREIARLAHGHGALMLVDGAQSVPHLPLNVQELDCDFLAFSSHKMLGPTGIGVLYGRRALLEEMEPFLGGGDMIREVHLYEALWNELPWKFEAGTPAIAEAIGLGAAVDYLQGIGMAEVREHELELASYALERIGELRGITIYGPPVPHRGGVVSFNLEGIHPHDLAALLDREGIAIRAGHHCAQPLMERLGVAATARVSFYLYNMSEEVDRLIEGIGKARRLFGV